MARQFAKGKRALVVRNGYFSYRWSDIFDQTSIASEVVVLKASLETGATDAKRPQVKPQAVVRRREGGEGGELVLVPV